MSACSCPYIRTTAAGEILTEVRLVQSSTKEFVDNDTK